MPHFDVSVQPNSKTMPLENAHQAATETQKTMESSTKTGKVYLVGAGPGDPRLITLRGVECLRQADVVLFDGLANAQLLEFAEKAEKVSVGKHGTQQIWSQTQINEAIVSLALSGKTVVRLKGGDPAVFARTAEELEALEAHQIPFEVVPGITAALAVAGYTGIPLTHRDHASAVALVTGQQQEGSPDDLDWESLARFPGTLIVYMGVTTSRKWTSSLIAHGKPASTPAAIVRRCSWGDQIVIRCTLSEVGDYLTPATKLRPPVLVVVGEVAKLGRNWNWFEQLPLHGRNVWLPRPGLQSVELREMLVQQGATVYTDPVVEIRSPVDTTGLEQAVKLLTKDQLDGVTFSSVNGVDYFFKYLFDSSFDVRILGKVKLATVGPATSKRLERYGLKADFQPTENFSAASLVEQLGQTVAGKHWLVTTTNHSQQTLADGLATAGALVTPCLTYETVDCAAISNELQKALSTNSIQFAIITSSHIARAAKQIVGDSKVSTIAFGSKVAEVLAELGWTPIATSEKNTIDSLQQAVQAVSELKSPV